MNSLLQVFKKTPILKSISPIKELKQLSKALNSKNIYIKDDSNIAAIYSGNKARKLEFLLADAISKNKKRTITFGSAGSNHALATAVHANQRGLKHTSILSHQDATPSTIKKIQMNILMALKYNSDFIYFRSFKIPKFKMNLIKLKYFLKDGAWPYIIPVGGTNSLGILGFINAIFELKTQIDKKEIPEPDFIYAPMGTMGTIAGLIIGLKLLNLKTKVVCVRVIPEVVANSKKLLLLLNQEIDFLNAKLTQKINLTFTENDFIIRDDFYEPGYAIPNKRCIDAVELINQTEQINLEYTYSGKALACLIDDARKGLLNNKITLFWNTYNNVKIPDDIYKLNYKKLPKELKKYFR